MKTKHLLATVAVASAFVGCSQEELVNANNEMQALENRPMVEAPVIDLGVESRMTTNAQGNFATVKWQEGDGFGAAVMDNYNAAGTTWETMFPIQNHINSNVLFSYNNATGKFEADASMPMGNHLFYAPFNKANISRQPLAVAVPLAQVVKPVEGQAVSNSVVTAFYEDETTPVFFAYDTVEDEAKTSLSLNLNHIFALPHVTLDFGKVRLSDELTVDTDGDNIEDDYTYETSLTISKIVFTNPNNKILTAGTINNKKVIDQLKKDGNGKYLWKENTFETNTTAAILNEGVYNAASNKFGQVTDKDIVVTFEGGKTINDANDARFIMILPGAEYKKQDLAIEVYATIDGEEYVLVNNLSSKTKQTIAAARDMRLLPGYPYAADEYSATGTPKASKGTSFSYIVEGPMAPVKTAVEAGYYEIETYADLKKYIEEVAYRGEALEELTAEQALAKMKAETYDRRKQFVITATEEAPIVIDDALVEAFNDACVISGGEAKLTFLGGNANVVLGNMNYDADATQFVFTAAAQVAGNVSIEGDAKVDFPKGINLLSTATVDLTEDLTEAITVANVKNGTVELNSALAHDIWNDYGTLNVNVSTAASLSNGYLSENKEIENYIATMKVADDVVTSGTVNNRLTGVMEINDAIVTVNNNNGKITMNDRAAKLTVASGTGSVNNTVGAKVSASTNEVYAEVSNLNLSTSKYDEFAGLNTIYLNSIVTSTGMTLSNPTYWSIKTINFESGSGINFAGLNNATLDLTGTDVEKININANVTWRGRDVSDSQVLVKAGAIEEAPNCSLTIIDLAVPGYTKLAANAGTQDIIDLIDAATPGEEITIALSGNAVGNGIVFENGDKVILDLNGKTLDVSEITVGSPGTQTLGMQLLKGSKVTIKNGTIKGNSATCKRLIQNYADLTLEDVTLVGTDLMEYVVSFCCGNVNIKGNTNIIATAGNYAFDVYYYYPSYDNVSVTVNTTGTITGNVEYSAAAGSPAFNDTNKAELIIEAGTFNGNFVTALDKTYVTFGNKATYKGSGWSK